MRSRLALPLLLVVGAAAVIWLWPVGGTDSLSAGMSRDQAEVPAAIESLELPGPSSKAQEPSQTSTAREPLDTSRTALRGRVLTSDGAPIPDARVVWLALEKEDTEATAAWPRASWGAVPRRTLERRADAEGAFAFSGEEAGAMPHGSVLLAWHPEFAQGGADLGSEPASWPAEVVLRLEPAEVVVVTVLDGDGRPRAGAIVHHSGAPRSPPNGKALLAAHERFLAREGITDAAGQARFSAFPGEQAFWAEHGEELSVPWQGVRPTRVVLRLGASFTVGGTLTLPDWSDWDGEWVGERRILVSGQEGELWRPLARLRDVEAGRWGPLRVPLGAATAFAVRLEGIPITPLEERFAAPAPGAHRSIDFAAVHESECYFLVQNEAGEPIPSARAIGWWGDPSMPQSASSPRRVEGAARSDGILYLGGFPEGRVSFQISAPGYSFLESEGVTGEHYQITLQRGGRVEGRCLSGGKPVTDFELVYWMEGPRHALHTASFFDREDGRFTLDDLNAGDWFLGATTSKVPMGRPLTVHVAAERTTEVELELAAALSGGGRVLDAESGEPIPGARVQPYSSGGIERCLPWGPEVRTEHDGTFLVEAFVAGTNYVTVEAPGHARTDAKAFAKDGDFLDFGDIRLPRPGALELRLLGLEELRPWSPLDLKVTTMNSASLAPKHFDAKGRIRFEEVPPGTLWLFLNYPDGEWTRLELELEPGGEWRYDFKVAGDRRLRVRALDERGEPVPEGSVLGLVAQEDNGVLVLRMKNASAEGRVEFEGVRASQAQVWIVSPSGSPSAQLDVTLTDEPGPEVTIRLGQRSTRIRVVDREGQPLVSAWVSVRSASGSQPLGHDDTDGEGWATILGLPPGTALLDLAHGLAGRRLGLPFDCDRDEQTFVLDERGSVELRVVDGTQPLVGATARLETPDGLSLTDPTTTDADGRVRFGPLGDGAYVFGCRRSDAWPARLALELGPDEHVVREVQMRRLADLELYVLDADGLPVADAEIRLRSLEFGTDVADWVGAERVVAPGGVRTDGFGVLRIFGLPRGSYRWSVRGDELSGGALELLPGSANRLEARIGPR